MIIPVLESTLRGRNSDNRIAALVRGGLFEKHDSWIVLLG